jgi:hypothetical protein
MKRACWVIGITLDWLHIPLAIIFLLLGKLWLPNTFHWIMLSVVISLQVLCLGCPLNVLTYWLRRQHDLDYNYKGSFTYYIYGRYGRMISIPVFCGLAFSSWGIAYYMQSLN